MIRQVVNKPTAKLAWLSKPLHFEEIVKMSAPRNVRNCVRTTKLQVIIVRSTFLLQIGLANLRGLFKTCLITDGKDDQNY